MVNKRNHVTRSLSATTPLGPLKWLQTKRENLTCRPIQSLCVYPWNKLGKGRVDCRKTRPDKRDTSEGDRECDREVRGPRLIGKFLARVDSRLQS